MEVYSATASVCIWKHMWQRQTRAHARMHVHTQTCTHTHTCAHTHIYTHVCMHTHTHTHARTHTCMHTRTHTHMHTHTHAHTYTQSHKWCTHKHMPQTAYIHLFLLFFAITLIRPILWYIYSTEKNSYPYVGTSTVPRRTATPTLVHIQYRPRGTATHTLVHLQYPAELLPIP